MTLANRVGEWVSALRPLFWPTIVAVLLGCLVATGELKNMVGRLRKVSGAGLDFEFSEDGAPKTRQTFEESFATIRRQLRREFDRLARIHNLAEKRQTVVRETLAPLLLGLHPGASPSYRCTVHVPDPLFQDHLYQLLDYYPDGGGRGRSFSIRVGLIGLVWRAGRSLESQDLVDEAELIGKWGMTAAEADASRASGRRSFIGVLLTDLYGVQVGVVYLDSKSPETFGRTPLERQTVIEAIASGCREKGLTANLATAVREMRRKSPEIDLEFGERG